MSKSSRNPLAPKERLARERKSAAADKVAPFGVLDLETPPFKKGRLKLVPFLAGFFDGKTTLTFWGPDCCERLIEVLKRFKGIVYAHNGGNFDFHLLLEFLPVADCEFLCIGKRIVQIKTPWGCTLRDSFAIIPKRLGSYKKTAIDYTKFEANRREKWRTEITNYLKDDLKDLHEMVSGFRARFPDSITLAGATYKILQKNFDAEIERSGKEYDETFRPFYYGGRVQFWTLGQVKHRCVTVDINSAYPFAMTFDHPHGVAFRRSDKLPKKNAGPCFVEMECFSDGELPVRTKTGVDFPVGRGVFKVTGWEFLAAMELRKIRDVKIREVLIPDETRNFKRFVEHFYGAKLAAKKAGDKEEEFFNKIVLNAGYGKFALNPEKFTEVCVTTIFDTPPDIDGKTDAERERNADLAGWEIAWDDEERGLTFHRRDSYQEGIDKFVNVATAASITGHVRAFLMREKAKCKGVVYCDTDSLTARDVSALKLGDELGQWKKEMTFAPGKFWIAGKKLYAGKGVKPDGRADWKFASKGVRFKPEEIIAVARGEEREHESEAPTYSVFTPPKFVRRMIRRADKRKN